MNNFKYISACNRGIGLYYYFDVSFIVLMPIYSIFNVFIVFD